MDDELDFAELFDQARSGEHMAEQAIFEASAGWHSLAAIDERFSEKTFLAEGGMKRLYRTVDRMTGRETVYAVLKDISSTEVVERFVREARILSQLEHPHIVPVHDIGLDEDGAPYFIMKLIRGESLSSILEKLRQDEGDYRQRFSLTALLDLYMRVCEAVAFAHSHGVLHLDIKPDNIQVSDFGQVFVCDWGLAKFIGEEEPEAAGGFLKSLSVTQCGEVRGTPGFMAPEQVTGDEKTEQTDVYGLGALLYAILTWEQPFAGEEVEKVLQETLQGRVVRPQLRSPQRFIPVGLEAVALKAMALSLDERYQQVEGLIGDIQAYRDGFATRAEEAR